MNLSYESDWWRGVSARADPVMPNRNERHQRRGGVGEARARG